jgi:hypothetical protein
MTKIVDPDKLNKKTFTNATMEAKKLKNKGEDLLYKLSFLPKQKIKPKAGELNLATILDSFKKDFRDIKVKYRELIKLEDTLLADMESALIEDRNYPERGSV